MIFSDGTGMALSQREWGALAAAAWSEADGRTYGYMDFYVDSRVTPQAGDAFAGDH